MRNQIKNAPRPEASVQTAIVSPVKKQSRKPAVYVIGGVLVIALLCLSGYLFYQYQQLKKELQNSPLLTQQQIQLLTTQVGTHMLLPNGLPTVFTVTDRAKLQSQPFFHYAQNGDTVLVYASQKEAILFSPARNRIISVGPVNFTTPQPSPSPSPLMRIGIRNGTITVGLTTKVEATIQKAFPNTTIAFRDQDAKTDYPHTLVIPLSESVNAAASSIANTLNASVAALPTGETNPTNTDILVIMGKNYK